MLLSGMLVWILLVLSVLPGHGMILIRGMAEVYLSSNGPLRAVIILIYMSLWLMVHWLVCQNNTARSCLYVLVQKLCVVQLVSSCALSPSSSNNVYQLSNWMVNCSFRFISSFLQRHYLQNLRPACWLFQGSFCVCHRKHAVRASWNDQWCGP